MFDFEFHSPASLDEAIEMLERYGDDARLMAGGTSLVLQMKQRFAQPAHVIGLRSLARNGHLGAIERTDGERPEGNLRIGSLCTLGRLEYDGLLRGAAPLLADTVSRVATRRIRSMATIGGALVNGDPNQDPPPTLIALGASLEFSSAGGSRNCPVDEFFVDYYETGVRPGEVLTSVVVPIPAENTRGAFLKFLPRTAEDYATVSVAAMVSCGEDGACEDIRIALGSVGTTPVRAVEAEQLLRGEKLTEDAIRAAAATVPDAVDPLDDARGSADYKREMSAVFTRRAIMQALSSGAG